MPMVEYLRRIRTLWRIYCQLEHITGTQVLLGMTSPQEQSYLEKYARNAFSGTGEIVDLGCWLGSTTIPLARGLEKNRNSRTSAKQVHAYDLFIWEGYMDAFVTGTEVEGRYEPGQSFLEEFQERIKPWSHRVKICAGDICQIGWSGEKIELLVIDAMKSWKLSNSIVSGFFPSLIVNKSHILHEDFAHYYTSWIHLIHYRLRSFFRLMHDIPKSTSLVFEYVQEIPKEILNTQYSFSSFSDREIELAFEHSMSLVDKDKRASIAAAKVMVYIHQGDKTRAKLELDEYLSQGLSLESELKIVKKIIDEG